MTNQSRATLKGYFNTGDIPTEAQFANLIDSTYKEGVYHPEDFGASGNGTADDTTAVQDAIDVAEANGGGVVELNQTYLVTKQGTASFGLIGNIDYVLLVNSDNVHVRGPGTIKMTSMPTLTANKFAVLGFSTTTGWTEYPGTDEDGNWINNVGVSGITFDLSSIDVADRLVNGGTVLITYARYFIAEKCIFKGPTGDAAIHVNLSSKIGSLRDNIILGTPEDGIRIDGCRATDIVNNKFVGESMGYTDRFESVGVRVFPNKDNVTNSQYVNISENLFINCRDGAIVGTGEDMEISNNRALWDANHQGLIGIHLRTGSLAGKGDYNCDRSSIVGNRLYQGGGLATGIGIAINGDDEGANGDAIAQTDIVVEGNIIGAGWQQASVSLGPRATNCHVVNNVLAGDVTENVTASGNTITPNY